MKAPKADKDPFTQAVVKMRSHLIKCYACRFDFGENEPNPTCFTGLKLAVEVVRTADRLLEAKRKAVSTINGHVYACPDISAHGEAYAMTAEPLSVVAMQDGLF